MILESGATVRSASPTRISERSTPVPRESRLAVEEGLVKADKSLRRYGAIVERALQSWEASPQEWADYIAFLTRLSKAVQTRPADAKILPHAGQVASKLAQCLDPALPSGVHQKTLEVYAYIFSAFGEEHLSAHLDEYLAGLSTVLSFAALSVRPGLYALFEEHIIRLTKDVLRPALRSIILALLPAIEEETSEDFERAFYSVQSLESKFAPDNEKDPSHEGGGYFWQCFFLGAITSPSRRLGALNYLMRRLPRFTLDQESRDNDSTAVNGSNITLRAESVISPEPGLLMRCFISGLADPQMLIQRGFLDLLVSHLPLNSPVLQERVEKIDLDLLVSAAISILTRRDMSLNRRLWSWFLGPDPKETVVEPAESALGQDKKNGGHPNQSVQLEYFTTNGQDALKRCILAMLRRRSIRPTDVAKPFRICLSLMDRWEIGGSLVSKIFLPAMRSAFEYCTTATASDTKDVLRSVSLFFDGVEAHLIFANLNQLLSDDDPYAQPGNLALFAWTIEHFNVKDVDMLAIHIPASLLHLTSLLQNHAMFPSDTYSTALVITSRLAELLVPWSSDQRKGAVAKAGTTIKGQLKIWSREDIKLATARFYDAQEPGDPNVDLPLESTILAKTLFAQFSMLAQLAMEHRTSEILPHLIPIMTNVLSKIPSGDRKECTKLFCAMHKLTLTARNSESDIQYPVIGAVINLANTLFSSKRLSISQLLQLEPDLTAFLWNNLSPRRPKYHLEVVRSMWQFEELIASEDTIQISLLGLLRGSSNTFERLGHINEEAASQFAVLWNHTFATQPASNRRNSSRSDVHALEQIDRYRTALIEPLLFMLDALNSASDPGRDVVRRWLLGLSSSEQIFNILLARMHYFSQALVSSPDSRTQHRDSNNQSDDLEYTLGCLYNVLSNGNDWTWHCLRSASIASAQPEETEDGLLQIAKICTGIAENSRQYTKSLDEAALRTLEVLMNGPAAYDLRFLELDSLLLSRLTRSVVSNAEVDQGRLLRLITTAIKLRHNMPRFDIPTDGRPDSSTDLKSPSISVGVANDNAAGPIVTDALLSQILQCLRAGFSSQTSRHRLDQWLIFLATVLPTFSSAILSNLIPMVECFGFELDKEFKELIKLSSPDASPSSFAPEATIIALLGGLEMILARANDHLLAEPEPEVIKKPSNQSSTFLGNVTSGMFKIDGPSSRHVPSNSRLTVTLAFQDAIRVSLRIWSWATGSIDVGSADKTCAATTAYGALRVRNKTRQLLEHIFAQEPLEGLEVVVAQWCHPVQVQDAAAAMNLVHVMQASRPKNVIPAILDALCSRANISALPHQRQSSLTIDLTALEVTLFYAAYLESLEDDAMDEIWTDCINFLRDAVTNPMPYRQLLPTLLSIVELLARKVDNTNFGEQKRMRRELGDVFQRLLSATFTTLPDATITEPVNAQTQAYQRDAATQHLERKRLTDLSVVLTRVVLSLDIVVDSPERVTTIINNISTSLINPKMHAKSFPGNLSLDTLTLVLEMARKVPTAKSWKKDLTDAFNDPKLLSSSPTLMKEGWFPAFRQLLLRDKDRLTELLSRMSPPSTAGIMFGVGASTARLEADRKTQLNLRRICIVLLSAPEDTFVLNLGEMQEKLVELFDASLSSSPSAIIKAELFMLYRTLVLSYSSVHLSSFWPIINDKLQSALRSLAPNNTESGMFTNFSLLQACKLLDQLLTMSLDDFQLYQWFYIVDTVDAVYRPSDWSSSALTEHAAEALATSAGSEDNASPVMIASSGTNKTGKRRPMMSNDLAIDKDDLKALAREDFVRTVLRPFLSQLSMYTYEGVYSLEEPDLEACRDSLLEDILDQTTLIE